MLVPPFPVFAADCTAGLTPGDANGDGKVNVKDVMTILKHVASWDVEMNADNADVRRDGKVNVSDAMLILKVSAGWEDVRLGHKDETAEVSPTCLEDGGTFLVCTLCESRHMLEEAKATGHRVVDGVCTLCSWAIPNYSAVMEDLNAAMEKAGERLTLADDAYLASLDAKADGMKQAVLSARSEYEVGEGGKIYYFSAEGNDTNDGLSPDSPKKSLTTLKTIQLDPGDVVLFRRGDTFNGSITAKAGVTYSAYGEGAKPVISGALDDLASSRSWKATKYDNVWKLNGSVNNVGIVMFNRTWEAGNYEELTGVMRIPDDDTFWDERDLANDREFYCAVDDNELFLYCSEGNPGEVYDSILVGNGVTAIYVGDGVNDVTVDNLHVTLTGAHGVGGRSCSGLTVRNCLFDYLGGSILLGYKGGNTVRFGNAVEIYGAAKDYTVYNNWIYQIYDTGITHQFSTDTSVPENIHDGVEYYGNLVEYCFWSIEYYNYKAEGCVRETKNVSIHDNFCRFGGMGWGCPGRENGAPLLDLNFRGESCETFP